MQSIRQEILPPSGVEFATSLRLIPSTVDKLDNPTLRQEFTARTLCNVVVARTNLLRIFEVREEPVPIVPQLDEERDRRSKVRKGTEAVEGEVAMDSQGEGFVNIAQSGGQAQSNAPTITKFYLIREHRLHGVVTGMEAIKTASYSEDKLDRLLVSFRDAKIALLEWSSAVHDLITVSIHTYERAPQLMSLDSSLFNAYLRVDPLSRCAALLLPKETFAMLPFHQTLDVVDQENQQMQARDVPYAPSFLLDLPAVIDPNIRHIIDFAFLPGFNKPTIAVLFQTQQTWTGRLKEFKDTVRLIIFTLDIAGQNYPIITSVQGLPYDSFSVLPCSTLIGGVTVITSNSIIYVDQISRKVTLPLNGWASRVSDIAFPPIPPEHQARNLSLEGSRTLFVDDKTMFVILKDGTVYPVDFVVDGKNISKLNMGGAIAQTTIPEIVRRISDAHLFIGSSVGPSVLLKAGRVEEEVDEDMDTSPAAVVQTNDSMDLDDEDEDLYGPSKKEEPTTNGAVKEAAKKTRTVIQLSLCDALPAHGPITDLAFSLTYNGDKPAPELVAATGAGYLGGFTLFQKDLPIRTKRKLHAIGGGRGMWSLPVRQSAKSGGLAHERPVQMDNDTVILSTDATPSPGLSRIASKNPRSEISIATRIPGMTVGAAPFFQRTAILQVMTNAIRILEPDGTERQIIKDMDGNIPRPKIRACSISDPYVLIFREDDTIGLFIGEADRGKIRRKDMSPMGDKTSRYLTGCFYLDSTDFLQANLQSIVPVNGGATTTVQSVTSGNNLQVLVLVRPQGVMEIWNLPKLALVFSTSGLGVLHNVLVDSHDAPALSLPQDPPRQPQDLDVEQALIAPFGESSASPHLFVFLRSGQLAVYQLLRGGQGVDAAPATPRPTTLDIKFVKILSKAFEIQRPEENERSIIAEQKRVSHMFVPFTTSPSVGCTFSGVFLTGDRPSWIIGTDKGGAQIYPSGHNVVYAFTSCSLWDSKGDFLVYSDEGPSLLEWIPDLMLGGPLPLRSVPRGRSYSKVLFDPSTMLVVAASSLQAQFASYDEDGNRVWEPDAPNVADPVCDCSTIELIGPDTWITMDGFEFATNEYINDIAVVTLETSSTESGSKDFIAVGTSIDRGEDLAVKGAAYIFEIVEVVPDPAAPMKRWYKLRLRCRDEAKGPVTAVCGFNGYLVSSMGQKVFVRAFDSDERLVGVAFIDVGVYVTSLKTLKNLLLVGDSVKSVMFVAFQEDPYKLVLLGKDVNPVCVTSADFFFTNGQLAIATGDDDGVVRLYEYNPDDPDSRDGRHLLLQTEYQTQSHHTSSVTVAMRSPDDPLIPYAKLLTGSTDGSLASLAPLDEHSFKRLQLLQGQLVRNVQHVAGLNPKAFRFVRNDLVSKPLSKGILDGNLLSQYEALPIPRQDEFTRQIGTDRTVVLKDWISLGGPW